jgi:hypothetical protein
VKTGKDSVVIGNIGLNAEIGEGSVVIGATDAFGNTIINQPMAIGRGAVAGPGSIAIGAGARAGVSVDGSRDLEHLAAVIARQNNEELKQQFAVLTDLLNQPKPDRSAVLKTWEAIKAANTLQAFHGLLAKISGALVSLTS